MTSSSPVLEGPCYLLTHKGYEVGEVSSFVKPTDLEPCDLVATEDPGVSALFDITRVCLLLLDQFSFISFLLDWCLRPSLFQVLVQVKALLDRCIAKEGVVTWVRKHNANLMNEQGQYKEAVRTLNQEVKELREKLVEASSQKQKLQEEVMALQEKVEMAGTDAVQKFKT